MISRTRERKEAFFVNEILLSAFFIALSPPHNRTIIMSIIFSLSLAPKNFSGFYDEKMKIKQGMKTSEPSKKNSLVRS